MGIKQHVTSASTWTFHYAALRSTTVMRNVRNMKKINQIYLLLSFLFIMCTFLAVFNFYYSYGYKELSNSHVNIEITNKINTQNDIKNLREMAHYFHTSYMGTLKEQSDSFSSFGKILTSIAVLCVLLIAMVYKSKFLTCSSSGRKKHAV